MVLETTPERDLLPEVVASTFTRVELLADLNKKVTR